MLCDNANLVSLQTKKNPFLEYLEGKSMNYFMCDKIHPPDKFLHITLLLFMLFTKLTNFWGGGSGLKYSRIFFWCQSLLSLVLIIHLQKTKSKTDITRQKYHTKILESKLNFIKTTAPFWQFYFLELWQFFWASSK